jgi:outer membrane protein OmpA-like peptidoglycan-associated protein
MAVDEPASVDTTVRRETSSRWAHRGLAGPWWLALLLIPLLLAALLAWSKGGDIEGDLKAKAEAALSAKGIKGATVDADGRDLTLNLPAKLPAGIDANGAQTLVGNLDGVRVAKLGDNTPGGDPNANPAPTTAAPTTGGSDGAIPGACLDLQKKINGILGANLAAFGEKKTNLEGDELTQVQKVASRLATCTTSASVFGHTDNLAGPSSPLSQRRADAVAKILTNAGVTVTKAEGVGAADPLGNNNTADGRDLNRFASIVVE